MRSMPAARPVSVLYVSAARLACHPDRPPAAASCPFSCHSQGVAFSGSTDMANAVHAVVPCSGTLTDVLFLRFVRMPALSSDSTPHMALLLAL